MKIQPNASDGQPSPLRFDLTKKVREAIQRRQPLPPPVAEEQASKEAQPEDVKAQAADVKKARDAHREQFKQRVSSQRAVHTANHADEKAAEVAKARAEYNAKLENRTLNAGQGKGPSSDSIEISAHSQKLADELVARSRAGDEKRDARVRELRDRYLEGKLDSKALADKAAQKMLEKP